eukprot:TRINITY_DN1716_c0_g1_i2.p1 TRINITY_DN1716_c0_g1~~TRINITY_DN1716_c0_g1_i2.p1  ORF type:complete len:217 (-),score=28.79 TRINITY_DN1716_c0_g1_i2:353-970(-)
MSKQASQRFNKEVKEPEQDGRTTIFLRGSQTSDQINKVLKDLYMLQKPEAVQLSKKQLTLRPFENIEDIERLCQKYETSLFAFGSSSKKRPHNLVLGRLYEHHLLDMVEFGVSNLKTISELKSTWATASKPCIIIAGEQFRTDSKLAIIANLFIDFFRGFKAKSVNLVGIDRVLFISIDEHSVIHFRHYTIQLHKSGTKQVPTWI